MSWNPTGMLVASHDPRRRVIWRLTKDAEGNEKERYFVYDGWKVLAEYGKGGKLVGVGIINMKHGIERITTNLEQCGGRACIRGMRIRVTDVLDLLMAGLSKEEILKELPDLEMEDIYASIAYARREVDHPVLAV